MSRIALALLAASIIAVPAEAASLVHPSATAKTTEKGVAVWRGPAIKTVAAPTLKGARAAPCIQKTVVVYANALPERRLRTQGFWSGDGLTPAMRLARRAPTQGFYADRMAAGY